MATLAGYMQKIQRLLGDEAFQRYNPYDLFAYINEARGQIAAEGECIRLPTTLTTANGQNNYLHSALGGLPTGVNAVVAIWSITYEGASPPLLLEGRPYGWFELQYLTLAQPVAGTPAAWAQYQQGTSGSFYIGPTPNGAYSLSLDSVGEPSDLKFNTDPELIPYPWVDAVPYYASHLALRSEGQREQANEMLGLFETYMERARGAVTPHRLPGNFPGDWRSRQKGGQAMSATVVRGTGDFPPMASGRGPQG